MLKPCNRHPIWVVVEGILCYSNGVLRFRVPLDRGSRTLADHVILVGERVALQRQNQLR